MSILAKLLLVLSAFAPALLAYALVSAMNGEYIHSAIFLILCLAFAGTCFALLRFATSHLQSRSYRTETVQSADNEVFGLLLVYVLPLLTRDLASYNWYIWILVTLLYSLVVSVSYCYHFNPLLIIMGYHFYKVTEVGGVQRVLITRRRIYKTGEEIEVASLAAYVLIEKDPND